MSEATVAENTVTEKAAPTAGPWSIHPYSTAGRVEANDGRPAYDYRAVHIGAGDTLIAEARMCTLDAVHGGYPSVDNDAECFANAHLIAAAPEMLAILKTTAGNIRSLGPAGAVPFAAYEVWLALVDAAIAKAEGRS